MTSVDRTAYPGFARVVSARELTESFTPTDAEIEWARGRTQDERHLLALAVWLKAYQRLGYFPKIEAVPAVVVDEGGNAARFVVPGVRPPLTWGYPPLFQRGKAGRRREEVARGEDCSSAWRL